MPSYSRLQPIELTKDIEQTVRSVNAVIAEINNVFAELEVAEDITRGDGGQSPTFNSNLKAKNNRITGVARSRDPQDVITRRELEELGLLPNASGELEITADVTFQGRVGANSSQGGDANGLMTTAEVLDLVNHAILDEVASYVDGEPLTIEDAVGRNGRDEGTPIIGRDAETGKARLLQSFNDRLVIEAPMLTGLLQLLVERFDEFAFVSSQERAVAATITLDEVNSLIDAAKGEEVPVSRDGEVLSIEDAVGVDGKSEGTPIIGRDSTTGKARLLQSIGDRMAVESPTLASLLELLVHKVEDLTNELRNRG